MPLLSNVIIGRNDNYNPYFVNRLNYVVEYTAYLKSKYGIKNNEIEIIIVDWGSDNLLKNSLRLSKSASKIVRFIEINKTVANKESAKEKGYMNVAKAYNTAIRLSNAEYINFTSHDLIFDRISIINLINYLKNIRKEKKEILINIQRKFIPINLFLNTPSYDYLNRWLETSGRLKGDYGVMHGGGQAGYITSKTIWKRLTGIYEKFDGYGFLEYDFFSRATNICDWIDSTNIGVSMFKIHRGEAKNREYAKNNYLNKQWTTFSINPNKIWGLSNYNLSFTKTNHIKKLEIKNLKLIKYEENYYKNKLNSINKVIFNSFNIPVSIKIKNITFKETKIILALNDLLNFNKNNRSVTFIGYKKEILPLISSSLNTTLEMFILDDIYFISKKYKTKKNFSNLGLLDRRLIKIAQCLMDKKYPHKGYFRSFSGNIKKNIQSLNKIIPKEGICNIVFIETNMINPNNFSKINNFIYSNNSSIYCFFVEEEFTLSKLVKERYLKFNIHSKYNLYVNKSYKFYPSKNNFFKIIILHVSINTTLLLLNFIKIIKFLARKFLKNNR